MFTKHTSIPEDEDAKYLLDIDLSIFSTNRDDFEQYETNVRKEYHELNNTQYVKGRIQVIQKFLKRDRIYLTDYFRDKFEKKARENLEYLKSTLQDF